MDIEYINCCCTSCMLNEYGLYCTNKPDNIEPNTTGCKKYINNNFLERI